MFARYGLLLEGQPLEGALGGKGLDRPGYFWGSLFEVRQRAPLPNGACHYPVALLSPARTRIRCEICTRVVKNPEAFWQRLFVPEMYWPQLSPEESLMHLDLTRVFIDGGGSMECPLFILNPLFLLFHQEKYGMEVREVPPDAQGYASWRELSPWKPTP